MQPKTSTLSSSPARFEHIDFWNVALRPTHHSFTAVLMVAKCHYSMSVPVSNI